MNMNIKNEKLITKIFFDLDKNGVSKISGEARFYTDRIELACGGDTAVVSTEGIEEYRCTGGVGCVMLEAVRDGEFILICRAGMEYENMFSLCQKRLNKYLQSGDIQKEWLEYSSVICKKCGRPLPPGQSQCSRCAKKGRYLKRLWQMSKPYHKYIYASVAVYFLITAVNMLVPYVNRILVDDYIKADSIPPLLQYALVVVIMLALQILSRLFTLLRSYLQTVSANKIILMIRRLTFEKIENMSLARVSKRTSGELINRITDDTRQIQQFISGETGRIIENLLMLAAICVLLFGYDWKMAVLVLAPAPLVILSHRLLWGFMGKRFHKQWSIAAKANTVLHDIFSGIRVVKAFGMEADEHKRYTAAIEKERDTHAQNETYFSMISPAANFFMGLGEFFLLYFVGNRILNGSMTFGEMQQFSSYVAMLYGPLRWMSFLPQRIIRTMTSVYKVFDVIDEECDVTDKPGAAVCDASGVIEIENVSFGYENASNVLRGVDLTIQPGEMIGIVGRSGVGKSTLINLIMRMYDPDNGSVKISGTDIRDVTQESLRRQMGVVLQETLLFSGTLYENIAYSKPDATAEEVITAAKIADVHKFAVKLPDGYNTVIGEKGYTLSGGERQRVAIARALLHDPKILILDEATSALDTETEKDIQDALQKLTAGRTTIAIAHRLSTLRNATRLVVLDKGKVAEEGTHEELMLKKGLYFDLVMAQRQMSKIS